MQPNAIEVPSPHGMADRRDAKSNRLRIALVTREFLPETCWGGIGTFYRDYARELTARGFDVEIFTQSLNKNGIEYFEGVLVHHCMPRYYVVGPRRGGSMPTPE